MIYFDSERLKHPFNGFYIFCKYLGQALAEESTNHSEPLGFFLPKDLDGFFGEKYKYIFQNNLMKLHMPVPADTTVWHTSIQRSSYRPKKVPVLLTVHDLNYLYEAPKRKHCRYFLEYQRSIDCADRIVAISQFTKNDIMEHLNFRGKKVDVIYNGLPMFPGESKAPTKIPNNPFIYGIGSIVKKRNFHTVPCILAGTDYDLYISGRLGDDTHALWEQAKRWGVSDRVHLVGPSDEMEKKWYLEHCSALVHPTLADGFGLPPIEAMAYGKPVFLSNRTSLPEIGGPDAFYFNKDFDPDGMRDEFAKGMSKVDAALCERLRQRSSGFSWKRAAEQYWQVYEEML